METKSSSPKNETPAASPNAAASPSPKNFQRESSAPPPAKRPVGRPRKEAPVAGAKPASSASPAPPPAAPVRTAYPDPAPISAPMAVKGLLQAMTPIAGVVTAMATKLALMDAIKIWNFSPAELETIAKPGGAFMEKYAPSLDAFGVEIECAGAVFQVVFPKVLAIVAAKKVLEAAAAKAAQENAGNGAPAAEPSKPAPPAPTPIRVVNNPTPPATSPLTSEDFEIEVEPSPPNPFAPELNSAMPAAAGGGLL